MAVVEDRIVRPVSLFELVETLSDEEAADAVASHDGKRRLEKVQATERGELVEHQQQAVAPSLGGKVLGQAPPDLIEDQPDQGLGARDVGWRSEEHTSELQSLMRISYAVFCLKKKKIKRIKSDTKTQAR